MHNLIQINSIIVAVVKIETIKQAFIEYNWLFQNSCL